MPKKRVEKAPEFERTRENNAEFSDASAAGKLIRDAFLRTMFIEPDSGCVNRLSVRMLKILQTDMQGARGSRKVSGGNLKLLQGFEFNKESRLRDILYLLPEPELDQDGGTVTATFEPFIPQCVINAPEKTTHFRFSIGVASLDFTKKKSVIESNTSNFIPWSQVLQPPVPVTVSLPGMQEAPLVIVVCVEFFRQVRGFYSPLKDGACNAAAVVSIELRKT